MVLLTNHNSIVCSAFSYLVNASYYWVNGWRPASIPRLWVVHLKESYFSDIPPLQCVASPVLKVWQFVVFVSGFLSPYSLRKRGCYTNHVYKWTATTHGIYLSSCIVCHVMVHCWLSTWRHTDTSCIFNKVCSPWFSLALADPYSYQVQFLEVYTRIFWMCIVLVIGHVTLKFAIMGFSKLTWFPRLVTQHFWKWIIVLTASQL